MSNLPDWKSARRESARAAIVAAAWEAVGEVGLSGLAIRDLAKRAGITTPTIYVYFSSKNDVYDAMFLQAAEDFEHHMTAPASDSAPKGALLEGARRFMEFCRADTPRYQLLFQRTIPGFEPSVDAYAPAVRALEVARNLLASVGISDSRSLDLWTALNTGLVDQQIANDPDGERWAGLLEDAVAMFLTYVLPRRQTTRSRKP
ncbi:MAG TPA: TetR/AcrR family transcriptional regulator [Acidimicrobiales bacterium]|nr:TetR/AcrR family transcriptional regulator [Acidimicrobiales bacterium]